MNGIYYVYLYPDRQIFVDVREVVLNTFKKMIRVQRSAVVHYT